MENATAKKNNVFFCEDFSSKDLSENKVGRKGLSLFHLKDMDVPVPEFFVISGSVFTDFCFRTIGSSKDKLLEKGKNPEGEEIENVLLKQDFSDEVASDILSAYTRLSGFTDAWVSVRSSVIFPENKNVSFSGIFGTELNVRKFEDLKMAVKKVYASVFTDDVVAYASKVGIDISDVKLSVVVQKMVQAEISGVAFTIDPITQDDTKLSIEAVYGLGDVIALGEITPDSYLLNKRDLSIIEKHIAPQEWMKVRTMKPSSSRKGNVEKIKISPSWSHRQKLNDKDMQEISKVALIIENKARESQNIEWVLSGGRLWVLQNKPLYAEPISAVVTTLDSDITRKSLREFVIVFVEKYRSQEMIVSQAMNEAQKIVAKNNTNIGSRLEQLINAARLKKSDIDESNKNAQQEYLVAGVGASFGNVVGKISVVEKLTDTKYTKQDILLVKKYSNDMDGMIMTCGGVVMETGGLTSDIAIICRELKIPAILGAKGALEKLKDGDWVKLDGNMGSVYRETPQSDLETVPPVVESYVEKDTTGVDLLKKEEKEEEIIPEEETVKVPKDSTLPPSATRVFSMANESPKKMFDFVGNSHGIVYVDIDDLILSDGRHPLAYVEDRKFVDYSAKLSEKILDYVNLAQGDEVILSLGSATMREFRDLTRGRMFEDDSLSDDIYGATHYMNNTELLKRMIKIVRRIRNIYKKRNVSIAIHSPMNEDMVKDFKKRLLSEGLRRTASFKVYAILDNPSEIIMADDILNTKIDGLILNMPLIAMQMQGIKRTDKNGKYDLSRNSVFKVVDNVLELSKHCDGKVIVIAENSKQLIKHCVQSGVYGVSVTPEDIAETRKLVSEEEARLILGR